MTTLPPLPLPRIRWSGAVMAVATRARQYFT
jgi:hypothetical protein